MLIAASALTLTIAGWALLAFEQTRASVLSEPLVGAKVVGGRSAAASGLRVVDEPPLRAVGAPSPNARRPMPVTFTRSSR